MANVENSIFSEIEQNGISPGSGIVTEDYNCFFNCAAGSMTTGIPLGTNSIEQDPKFTNAASADFSLQTSSPCHNTASDGSDRGAVQTTRIDPANFAIHQGLNASGNLMHSVTGNLFNVRGQLVRSGRDNGVYIYSVKTGNKVYQNSFISTR
jgi:hypothetical protein